MPRWRRSGAREKSSAHGLGDTLSDDDASVDVSDVELTKAPKAFAVVDVQLTSDKRFLSIGRLGAYLPLFDNFPWVFSALCRSAYLWSSTEARDAHCRTAGTTIAPKPSKCVPIPIAWPRVRYLGNGPLPWSSNALPLSIVTVPGT